MRLVTIIPAYNEESAIGDVVNRSIKYSDVIVVDDGSGDDTYNQAKRAGADVKGFSNFKSLGFSSWTWKETYV